MVPEATTLISRVKRTRNTLSISHHPTFDSILIDIQHEIYFYILLDQNVAYVKSDIGSAWDLLKWGLKFEIVLFRVSKSISRESL